MRYLILLVFTGCTFIDEPHYEVQNELRPYVDQFYIEAKMRGYDIKPENLLAEIKDIGSRAGTSRNNGIPYFAVDIDFYNDQIRLGRDYDLKMVELVVFHELGHLLLNLEHIEDGYIMSTYEKDWHNYAANPEFRKKAIDKLFEY